MRSIADSAGASTVLIVGGGIAGAASAECLSGAGLEVHLVERQNRIGGHVREMGCKAAETCLRCNVCVADEVLRSVESCPDVHLHTSTELLELRQSGKPTVYTAVLQPRNLGQEQLACRPAGSVPEQISLDVDAVVVATGFDPYDPAEDPSSGFHRYPNAITGVQAERQLAEKSGITRPSDGCVPRRIAFIQCVGSRSEDPGCRPEDADYCSAVCCAYALRMARRIQYLNPESEITVYYMDIQNFCSDFDRFYGDCRQKMAFVRSRPSELRQGTGDRTIRIVHALDSADSGNPNVSDGEFDLVILSVGIRPRSGARELAARMDVPLDEYGFFGLKSRLPFSDMQQNGIYAVGTAESPKDIAGCISQAKAVSAEVSAFCSRKIWSKG